MNPPLTINEQIEVLRSGADIATWALDRLGLPPEWRDTNETGNTERCRDAVNALFTLSRAELDASLAEQGLLPEHLGYVRLEPDSRDGHYFLARGDLWETYFQERGGRWVEAVFDDLGEARKFLLNLWLPVWLGHLRVPCRDRNGKRILGF